MASGELKVKVAVLLSYFQASLYAHLVAVAKNRDTATPELGSLPFDYEEVYRIQKVEAEAGGVSLSIGSRSRVDSRHESRHESRVYSASETHRDENSIVGPDDLITGSFQQSALEFTDTDVVWKATSQKIDLGGELERCVIRKERPVEADLLNVEMTFSDSEEYIVPQAKSQVSKAVLRSRMNTSAEPKAAKYVIEEELPKFEPVPVDKPAVKTLYAEVISTTYSLGGDGFVLHSGDIVMVLQFLTEYGLVECRWEGLQGLFPGHALRVITPEVEKPKFSGRILALAQRELLNVISRPESTTTTNKPSKLLSRLKQREKTPS